MDVEVEETAGARRRGRPARRVLVRWEGVDPDGDPWADSWVAWKDLRQGGAMEAAQEMWERKRGRPEGGRPQPSTVKRRRSGRLLGREQQATAGGSCDGGGESSDESWEEDGMITDCD